MASSELVSLLPENATDLELAVESVMHQKYPDANEQIVKQLSDPWNCPAEFLPWLAYSESVDVWNDRWPTATKRSVIANAKTVHANKGTMGGVTEALSALGVRMEMTSWEDMSPEGEVGTVSFELWINENFNPDAAVMFDAEVIDDITQTINRNKRLSVHYTLTLGLELLSQFGVNASVQLSTITHIAMSDTL